MTRPWTLLAVPGLGLGEESWAPTLSALPDGDPAAGDPARVAGLVLVGPTTDPRAATWPRLAARWVADVRHESLRQVPLLVRQYRRTTLRTMAVAMDAARRDRIVQPLTQATPVPVLVVRGRHDRICPEDWARRVAACGSPGSRGHAAGRGSHGAPDARPARRRGDRTVPRRRGRPGRGLKRPVTGTATA